VGAGIDVAYVRREGDFVGGTAFLLTGIGRRSCAMKPPL
jgi:hypothetical protein